MELTGMKSEANPIRVNFQCLMFNLMLHLQETQRLRVPKTVGLPPPSYNHFMLVGVTPVLTT